MQESAFEGNSQHNHDDYNHVNGFNSSSIPTNDGPNLTNGHTEPNDDEPPPSKRRKIAETGSTPKELPRPVSPPWRRAGAEGPTSFVEGGRRKSGRTNLVPLELQPQKATRQTRAALNKVTGDQKHAKPLYSLSKKTIVTDDQKSRMTAIEFAKRGPGRPPKSLKQETPQPVKKSSISKQKNGITPPSESPTLKRSPKTHRTKKQPTKDAADVEQIKREASISEEEELYISSSPSRRSLSPPLTLQKVTFRVRLPKPTIATPANIPFPKRYSSFDEFLRLDEHEPQLGQEALSTEQIQGEARIRNRIRAAKRPGGVLSTRAARSLPDKQSEPPRQYAHHDHLMAHVLDFRTRLRKEQIAHRRNAATLAQEAKKFVEQKRQKNRVKTKEEIEREEWERCRVTYKTVIKDVDKLWLAVLAEVQAARLKEYEDQQQAQMKGHLARVLDRTDQMLNRNLDTETSVLNSDEDDEEDSALDTGSSVVRDESDDSQQMSETDSDSSSDAGPDDPDENMTVEELQQKYGSLPELETASVVEMDIDLRVDSDAVEAADDEDSDPETEMDSELDMEGSNDENNEAEDEEVEADGEEEEEEEDEDDEEDVRFSLRSLFSKQGAAESTLDEDDSDFEVTTNPDESIEASDAEAEESTSPLIEELGSEAAEQAEKEDDQQLTNNIDTGDIDMESVTANQAPLMEQTSEIMQQQLLSTDTQKASEERASLELSAQTSPQTSMTKISDPESASSVDDHNQAATAETPPEQQESTIKTRVPSLLRGVLRIYQHEGLDWMANLYANGRSGILADEMGLGKTIQSIALLAHLAEVHEVWGPHLIVVPTSVMLNWEMEFKKFLPGFKILTYYGNQEERKQKRRGWMADDSFNVCITSYQLVLQDANSFKRRRWHYMILDEAHNIKNFRSERWQTMMTFNTQARLLLTGTPLQNNLTELWSLLFFLHYGQETEGEDDAFAGLKVWSEWFKKPVETILEHGRQVLDAEDKEQVAKLHKVIRPFLLRRLKADVEKQMPLKYEHVELCRLSKRQRQLYDGFMSRAQTKETLASGNYLSIINALMQLRKVCNHPDLFETRPINTSFAMPRSVAADFEIRDLLVRRRFQQQPIDEMDLGFLQLVPISCEKMSMIEFIQTSKKHAYQPLKALRDKQWTRLGQDKTWHGEECSSILTSLETVGRRARLNEIDRTIYYEAYRHHQHPVYGRGLIEKLGIKTRFNELSTLPGQRILSKDWARQIPLMGLDIVRSVQRRAELMEPYVHKYACITPAVVANDLSTTAITEVKSRALRQSLADRPDPFHEARMKLSIAFPDKRLLQYDCGKLQRLEKLLRQLQAGGHRALIFTQMTKVLDILEQFLNIHGHRYLRLDGATKIEQRQILTDRFNNDNRILVFILSSRSGGLGINLTGADTVIFYDLDWNPAMDKQCTDRAHRIGQTRDVHIYRFVSEHTIESNILRKASQKQMLDDVVIQEGDFTTDYTNKLSYRDMLDDNAEEEDMAGAAMDRVLGNDKTNITAFEHAEDKEDIAAAKVAAREVQHADDGDFEDKAVATDTNTGGRTSAAQTPGPFAATDAALHETEKDTHGQGHVDEYMVKLQKFLLKDAPLGPSKDRRKKGGRKRRDEHRIRRVR